jgi:hypothetical protein
LERETELEPATSSLGGVTVALPQVDRLGMMVLRYNGVSGRPTDKSSLVIACLERRKAGMTYRQIAAETGVSPATAYRYCRDWSFEAEWSPVPDATFDVDV